MFPDEFRMQVWLWTVSWHREFSLYRHCTLAQRRHAGERARREGWVPLLRRLFPMIPEQWECWRRWHLAGWRAFPSVTAFAGGCPECGLLFVAGGEHSLNLNSLREKLLLCDSLSPTVCMPINMQALSSDSYLMISLEQKLICKSWRSEAWWYGTLCS